MPTVRLCAVPYLDQDDQTKNQLLPLYRFGWISSAQRPCLSEPAYPARLSGCVRLDRSDPVVGRSGVDPDRNQSPNRGRTEYGPCSETRAKPASTAGAAGGQHGAPGHRVSGGTDPACRVAPPNAEPAQAATGGQIRAALFGTGRSGPGDIRPTRRDVIRLSSQTPCSSRYSRCGRTSEDSPAGRQRNSGRQQCDPNPPLYSSVRFRSWNVWHGHSCTDGRLTRKRVSIWKLPFAYGESRPRLAAYQPCAPPLGRLPLATAL